MSLNFYPIIKKEPMHSGYEVKINGNAVELDTARVSACHYNRRWPGHQREIKQSELINFISLATDEPLEFEITPEKPFENAVIRPHSLGIEPTVTEDGKIRFTLLHPAYFVVEPYGRHDALHIFADPMPTYNISLDDPHILYYGAGEHDVGQIELHSGDTLFLDEGAVVYACVTARDEKNIKILGRGILDNSKNKEKILFEVEGDGDMDAGNAVRQHTIQLEYCDNVLIDGITVRDSLVYNIRPIGCRELTVKNVKIIGCWRYNSDGIDMHNCENVLIENCFIRTFDDAICVKGFDFYGADDVESATREATYHGGEVYDTFKNVLVKKCVLWNDWGKCLEIGAETKAEEICNIFFEDCDCIHTYSAPIDCMNVDYADVHDIAWRNIRVELDEKIPTPQIQSSDEAPYDNTYTGYVPKVIYIKVKYHPEYSVGGDRRGKNRDISVENIQVFGDVKPTFKFYGHSEKADCRNILIRNVYLNGKLLTDPSEYDMQIGDFCENIRYEAIEDNKDFFNNTVSSKGQMQNGDILTYECKKNAALRVLFVGNSITLHSVRPEIGWHRLCGMAASAPEKDYVHRTVAALEEKYGSVSYMIAQIAEWERDYDTYSLSENFAAVHDFNADLVIIRVGENTRKDTDELLRRNYREEFAKMICFFRGNAQKTVVTSLFWSRAVLDDIIKAAAEENGCILVNIGHLGASDENKAIGEYEHSGVASHPNDRGMQAIADAIVNAL